jgi:hypothetical protein
MNSQQAGINANCKHDDQAVREWARAKQRPANAERAQFSLAKSGNSYIAKRENEPTLNQLDSSPVDILEKSADEIKPVAAPGK